MKKISHIVIASTLGWSGISAVHAGLFGDIFGSAKQQFTGLVRNGAQSAVQSGMDAANAKLGVPAQPQATPAAQTAVGPDGRRYMMTPTGWVLAPQNPTTSVGRATNTLAAAPPSSDMPQMSSVNPVVAAPVGMSLVMPVAVPAPQILNIRQTVDKILVFQPTNKPLVIARASGQPIILEKPDGTQIILAEDNTQTTNRMTSGVSALDVVKNGTPVYTSTIPPTAIGGAPQASNPQPLMPATEMPTQPAFGEEVPPMDGPSPEAPPMDAPLPEAPPMDAPPE